MTACHYVRLFKNWVYQETTGLRVLWGCLVSVVFFFLWGLLCSTAVVLLGKVFALHLFFPCLFLMIYVGKHNCVSMLQVKSVCPVGNLPPTLLECRNAKSYSDLWFYKYWAKYKRQKLNKPEHKSKSYKPKQSINQMIRFHKMKNSWITSMSVHLVACWKCASSCNW